MSRRETPGHRGLSSEENANMLNGKEWWPNEAELVDPTAAAPMTMRRRRGGREHGKHDGEDRRGFHVIKTPLLAAFRKNRGSGYCDNIFLGA